MISQVLPWRKCDYRLNFLIPFDVALQEMAGARSDCGSFTDGGDLGVFGPG